MSDFPVHNSPCSKRALVRGSSLGERRGFMSKPRSRSRSRGREEGRLTDGTKGGLATSDGERTSRHAQGEGVHPTDGTGTGTDPTTIITTTNVNASHSATTPSFAPLPPQSQVLYQPQALTSECTEKLVHPMHTLGIENLCSVCIEDREARLAAFRQRTHDDMNSRMSQRFARSSFGGGGGGSFGGPTAWQGRKFRATTRDESRDVSPPEAVIMPDEGAGDGAADDNVVGGASIDAESLFGRRPESPEDLSSSSELSTDNNATSSTSTSQRTSASTDTSANASVVSSNSVGGFMRGVVGWKPNTDQNNAWSGGEGRSLFSGFKSSGGIAGDDSNRASRLETPAISPKSTTPVNGGQSQNQNQVPAGRIVDPDDLASLTSTSTAVARAEKIVLSFGGFDD